MGTVATVTIGTDTFSVYALTAAAEADLKTYMAGRFGTGAYDAATSNDKKKALVTATRMLDRVVKWSGTQTGTQPLQWPRDGAFDGCSGTAVPNGTTPDALALGAFELTLALLTDSSVQDSAGTGSNTKRVKAGSAEVEFFSPTIGTSSDLRLPQTVNDLVGCFIASTGTFGGSWGTATTDAETYDSCDDDRNQGYA